MNYLLHVLLKLDWAELAERLPELAEAISFLAYVLLVVAHLIHILF